MGLKDRRFPLVIEKMVLHCSTSTARLGNTGSWVVVDSDSDIDSDRQRFPNQK